MNAAKREPRRRPDRTPSADGAATQDPQLGTTQDPPPAAAQDPQLTAAQDPQLTAAQKPPPGAAQKPADDPTIQDPPPAGHDEADHDAGDARDDGSDDGRNGQDAGSAATLYDVARLAEVSIATVSRVVHGQDLVRDSTRARVLDVIEQLGYVPDGAAQSLSRRRKDVIGLVCVETRVPKQYDVESMALLFYDEVLRGVESLIRRDSRSLLITYVQDSAPDLPRLLSLSGKVDGLLIGEGVVPSSFIARLAKRLPVVVIAGSPGERAADVVTADNHSGSVALITHLVEDHGRRRLYQVEGPPTAPDAKERSFALTQVLKAHPECELVGSFRGSFAVQSGEEAGEQLLAMPAASWPDAVVCANDQTAIGVLQALARGRVHVPEQLAVVGFDDIFPGSLLRPALTTVHQPMRLLGERACARLLERIARPSLTPRIEMLPTELVLRSSCGCPPGTEIRHPVPLAPRRRASREAAAPRGGRAAAAALPTPATS